MYVYIILQIIYIYIYIYIYIHTTENIVERGQTRGRAAFYFSKISMQICTKPNIVCCVCVYICVCLCACAYVCVFGEKYCKIAI